MGSIGTKIRLREGRFVAALDASWKPFPGASWDDILLVLGDDGVLLAGGTAMHHVCQPGVFFGTFTEAVEACEHDKSLAATYSTLRRLSNEEQPEQILVIPTEYGFAYFQLSPTVSRSDQDEFRRRWHEAKAAAPSLPLRWEHYQNVGVERVQREPDLETFGWDELAVWRCGPCGFHADIPTTTRTCPACGSPSTSGNIWRARWARISTLRTEWEYRRVSDPDYYDFESYLLHDWFGYPDFAGGLSKQEIQRRKAAAKRVTELELWTADEAELNEGDAIYVTRMGLTFVDNRIGGDSELARKATRARHIDAMKGYIANLDFPQHPGPDWWINGDPSLRFDGMTKFRAELEPLLRPDTPETIRVAILGKEPAAWTPRQKWGCILWLIVIAVIAVLVIVAAAKNG